EAAVIKDCSVMYLFGRTRRQPYEYYFRTVEVDADGAPQRANQWSYWEKIDVQVNSPFISSRYIFSRLFVFWVELQADANKLKIVYSYQNPDKTWVLPQTIFDGKVDAILASQVDKATSTAKYHKVMLDRSFDENNPLLYITYPSDGKDSAKPVQLVMNKC